MNSRLKQLKLASDPIRIQRPRTTVAEHRGKHLLNRLSRMQHSGFIANNHETRDRVIVFIKASNLLGRLGYWREATCWVRVYSCSLRLLLEMAQYSSS